MDEAPWVAPGRSVPQGQLTLADLESRADSVDRHADLAAEARREREAGLPCRGRERPLAGEWLAGLEPAQQPDQLSGTALRDPEASALALLESRDGEVRVLIEQSGRIAEEVGIAEEQRARARLALGEAQGLSLAESREAHDPGSCALGRRRSPVTRAVVGDHYLGLGKLGAQSRHRRRDRPLLVARRDEDGQPVSHSRRRPGTAAGAGRRIP